MRVRGVFTKAYVRDDQHLRDAGLQCLHCPLHNSIGTVSLGGSLVFVLGSRNAEKENRTDPHVAGLLHLLHQAINRQVVVTRKGLDLLANAVAGNREQGPYQIVHRYAGLAD